MGGHPERLVLEGRPVAVRSDGADLDRTLAPRPYLHPVFTLGGTAVTDAVPDDHRWHLGVSVAVQDVGGANLWGGRTYVRDQGYTWLDDHGSMRHRRWRTRSGTTLDEELAWLGPRGEELVAERRAFTARPCGDGWALDIAFTLRSSTGAPIPLGSPATNGRAGAPYGGLFWRLPRAAGPARVRTPHAEGEGAVHQSLAPWIAYQGDDGDPERTFTVLLGATDERAARDPWFVRLEGYPGLGSALAVDEPLLVAPDRPERRTFTALVLDGHPADLDDLWRAALPADRGAPA